MRILLTGAAGFIGSNLSERLIREGHSVVGIDNFITGSRRNIENLVRKPNFEFVEQDVINPVKISGEINWVLHFASPASPPKYQKYSIETMRVNSEGTMHLLDLAKSKGASFLLASTSEVYGDPQVHPQPENYWGYVNPNGLRSCYDESKRFAEAITYLKHRSEGIPVRVIRIFNTYGPRMDLHDGRVVTNFIDQILHNRPITVYGDGEQTRSFQYIDDLVDGIIRVMQTEYYSPINLGNPEEHTILDLVSIFRGIRSANVDLQYLELPQDDPKKRKPDISLAKKILGWEPKVGVKEGIIKTLKYFEAIQLDSLRDE